MGADVSTELTTILVENFDVLAEDVSPDSTLDDLEVDSVSTVELVDILQERYRVRFGEDEITNKHTVRQVIDTLTTKTRTRA